MRRWYMSWNVYQCVPILRCAEYAPWSTLINWNAWWRFIVQQSLNLILLNTMTNVQFDMFVRARIAEVYHLKTPMCFSLDFDFSVQFLFSVIHIDRLTEWCIRLMNILNWKMRLVLLNRQYLCITHCSTIAHKISNQ